jgi:excisionase family DNA binding protein
VFAGVRASPSGPLSGAPSPLEVRSRPPVSVGLGQLWVKGERVESARGSRFEVVRAADVLTVREVAGLLKVSTATVYAMVERGELEHFRVSNSIRVRRAAVAALGGSP